MEKYIQPEMELILFASEDVLTDSELWEPEENETPQVDLFLFG